MIAKLFSVSRTPIFSVSHISIRVMYTTSARSMATLVYWIFSCWAWASMVFQACSMLCHILTMLSTVGCFFFFFGWETTTTKNKWFKRLIKSSFVCHSFWLYASHLIRYSSPWIIEKSSFGIFRVVYSLEQGSVFVPKVLLLIHGIFYRSVWLVLLHGIG